MGIVDQVESSLIKPLHILCEVLCKGLKDAEKCSALKS